MNESKRNKTIKITLPYPPTVNKYHVPIPFKKKNGTSCIRLVLHDKIKKYYKDIYYLCVNKRFKINQFIELYVILFPPDRRKRDLSNILKALEDALVYANVIKDDYLITRLIVERNSIVKRGKVDIMITQL